MNRQIWTSGLLVVVTMLTLVGPLSQSRTADAMKAASAAPQIGAAGRPLADLLNTDGTLDLNAGFSGSLDPTGWTMQTGTDGAPRFVPAAAAPAGGATMSKPQLAAPQVAG